MKVSYYHASEVLITCLDLLLMAHCLVQTPKAVLYQTASFHLAQGGSKDERNYL